MPTFSQAETGGLISKAAFNPGGEAAGGSPASSSRGDAIAIIAAGTRKGVYDGLYDFWQTLKGMRERALGAGVTSASFETGSGAGGAVGAGALAGRGGGPAGNIGAAVRGQGAAAGEDAAGGRVSGGSFMDALARIESSNQNIFSRTDPDVAGPGTRSQGYFQINTPTWREFAAGTRGANYPNAMSAPRDVQAEVASRIPLARFGPRTRSMLMQEFGALNTRSTIGALAESHGTHPSAPPPVVAGPRAPAPPPVARPATVPSSKPPPANIHIPNVYRGGQSSEYPAKGEVSGALAKHGAELRKMFGHRGPQKAPTIERPALPPTMLPGQQDVSLRPGDLARLTERGNRPEPGSLLRAADARQAAASATHKVEGSASLHVKLAAGLAPVGGMKTKGSLFREVRMDRAPLPLASTMG